MADGFGWGSQYPIDVFGSERGVNDRVSISGLLSKLSLIGFDYPSLEWFANFLQHRQQCVRLQSITSTFQTPLLGIPQGTVLGPMHFLIFFNDLSELIQNQASFFADDTTLHATDKSPLVSSCVSHSSDLDKAANWADRWGMLFSAPKSRHLPIGCEAQQSPSVFMKGAPIPQVRTHNHLGLIFSSTLTWNDHISNLYTTCARMTGILRRLDGSIPSLSMKKIYTAVIRPRTEYACAVWSGGPTERLQRLQDSFSKRHGIMLPPLQKRFDYHTLVLL